MGYTEREGAGRDAARMAARMARTLPVYRRVLPGERRVLPGEIRYADNGVAPEAAGVTVAGWVAPRDAIRLERLEIAHEWHPASGVTRLGAGDPPPGREMAGDPYPTRGADGQFGRRAGFAGYAADDPFAGYEEFAVERRNGARGG